MALIACSECGQQLSDGAAACPHCGCPVGAQHPASKPAASAPVVEPPVAATRVAPRMSLPKGRKQPTPTWDFWSSYILFTVGLIFYVGSSQPSTAADDAAADDAAADDTVADNAAADNAAGAVAAVAEYIAGNSLGIRSEHLAARRNPDGEGTFVYVQRSGAPTIRSTVWLVLDSYPYPLNGPAKKVTPSLPWPREVPEHTWSRTGLQLRPG